MKTRLPFSRREFFASAALSALGPLLQPTFASELKKNQKRAILIWMGGGPSQFETWDPKPGQNTTGPFESIATTLPGVRFNEHLPRLARLANEMVIVRSMHTSSQEHGQATAVGMSGQMPGRSPEQPNWLSVCAHELADDQWPAFVGLGLPSDSRSGLPGGGFLGPRFDPFACPGNGKPPDGFPANDADVAGFRRRAGLRDQLGGDFRFGHDKQRLDAHESSFQQVDRLLDRRSVFDNSRESIKRQDMYGHTTLGRDCLLACRLVERGAPFVLISGSRMDWDLHAGMEKMQPGVSRSFDCAVGALIDDLIARGLWQHTLVVLMGEFGRTPSLSGRSGGGRDHWSKCWSMSFGGGGVRGGVVVGSTDTAGRDVKERPIAIADLLVTFFEALGIDPRKEVDVQGRPTSFLERGIGTAIREVL